ncbi:MAG: hypothetical protein ACJ72D_07830, partial [Marmoricola sp.]
MSIQTIATQHPLLSMLDELDGVQEKYADVPAWSMSSAELEAAIPRLAAHGSAMSALGLSMLREADRQQVGDPNGFANTVGWYAAVTRSTKPQARRDLKLAERLDADEHRPVRAAALAGVVSVDQAAVIIKAVDDLPEDLVDTTIKTKAETHLIEFAAHLDPKQLRIAGRRILQIEAPEIADQALARVLEAEEAHAEATSYLRIHPDGHGSMIGTFKVPLLAGRILEKHVEAIAAPQHQNAVAAAQGTPAKPWRLGAAFTEYLQTRPATSVA